MDISAAASAEETWEDGVLILGDDDFDTVGANYPYLLVNFGAPWCGRCKTLAPAYTAAAHELEGTAVLAMVNADAELGLAERFGI